MAAKRVFKNSERGFTLIEIIIVIVILGILAVVAIPKYVDMRDDAAVAACDGVYGAASAAAAVNFAARLLSPSRTTKITDAASLVAAMEGTPDGWTASGGTLSTEIVETTYSIYLTTVEDDTPTQKATVKKDW